MSLKELLHKESMLMLLRIPYTWQETTRIKKCLSLLQSKKTLEDHQGNPTQPSIKPYSLVIIFHVEILGIRLCIVEPTPGIIMQAKNLLLEFYK